MNCELSMRLFAHFSLLVYISVMVGLAIFLRKMVRNFETQLIYASLCLWIILVVKDVAYFFGDIWYDTEVTNVLMSLDLWPIPIIAIILMYALQPQWVNVWRVGLMTLPFFVFTILNVIFKGDPTLFLINQLYGLLFSTFWGVIIFIITFKCDRYINANYSNKEHIDIRWVRYLIVALYFICALWCGVSINTTWIGDSLYYLTSAVIVFCLFYFIFKHKSVFLPNYMTIEKILKVKDVSEPKSESPTADRIYIDIEGKLDIAMNKDKMYLNPQLSLVDLANHIGTNRTYLSRYINTYKAIPFINYVNDFRLAEAYRILNDSEYKLSLLDVSEKCGFASYSTFRRVFKHKYGYPPSGCKKNQTDQS